MIAKISNEELDFIETFYNPIAVTEYLFSDFDNLALMEDDKLSHVRMGQFPLLSYEYLIDDDPELSEKENFQKKKCAGEVYCLGGRLFGKTLLGEKVDICLTFLLEESMSLGFSSYDALHIRGVLEDVILGIERHPIFKEFHPQITRSPNYRITAHGNTLEGVNMNLTGKKPGAQFFQKHFHKLWIEEASFETEEVYRQRRDSVSENGCIYRILGMTNFTKYSPCGKLFYDLSKRHHIVNLPQYCVAENSKILMSDFSYKNIQDVNIGDEILTLPEQAPFNLIKAKILNVFDNGIKNTVKLVSENNFLFITPDHKILTAHEKWSDKFWKRLNDTKPTDRFVSLPAIHNLHSYYEGMFYGFVEAEGYFRESRKTYTIAQKDELESLEHLLSYLKIKHSSYDDNTCEGLKRFSIGKSNYKYIQSIKERVLKEKDVAQGCLDGFLMSDGCIYISKLNKLQVTITQKNKTAILEKILSFLNVDYSKFYKDVDMFGYLLPKTSVLLNCPFSKKGKKLHNFLYKKCTIKSFRNNKIKYLKDIERHVYDLQTTTGTYIANGVVVHNCNPKWDYREKEKAIKDFNGEQSIGYRIFIKGEVVEEGVSVFDMSRVRKNYVETRKTKIFEINKEMFNYFEEILSPIETPKSYTESYISADIGEAAPTEITIIFKIKDKYRYVYNIILYGLSDKEQYKIFHWLGKKIKATYIALDTTDGTGRAIFRSLEEVFPRENLVWVSFNEKLPVDFERDDYDNVVMKKGIPTYVEEYVSVWSVKHLQDLLYSERMELPIDYKLDMQLNSVIALQSGSRVTYSCVAQENHLFQSFQVFSIAQWNCEFLNIKPISTKTFCKTGVG